MHKCLQLIGNGMHTLRRIGIKQLFCLRASVPKTFPGVHFKHRQCPGVDIHPFLGRRTFCLLSRAVLDRITGGNRFFVFRQLALCFCQTKICYLCIPIFCQEDIAWFDVLMEEVYDYAENYLPQMMEQSEEKTAGANYNAAAREFNQKLNGTFSGWLAKLLGIRPAEEFAAAKEG